MEKRFMIKVKNIDHVTEETALLKEKLQTMQKNGFDLTYNILGLEVDLMQNATIAFVLTGKHISDSKLKWNLIEVM